jgi:hypothetical protein
MRRTTTPPFTTHAWIIALLIGLVFAALEYGLRLEVEGAVRPEARSWLDLVFLLSAYLFVFCLKPIQTAVQRKLCLRAALRLPRKEPG